MNSLKQSVFDVCIIFAVLLIPCGCAESERERQLTKVARDWSQVITASQVLPVYPLTEDLRPGDIMLVDKPIEDQRNTYRQKGFLPLDRHLARLSHDSNIKNLYKEFYDLSDYGTINNPLLPPLIHNMIDPNVAMKYWKKLPIAAFPTYDFEIKTGQNMSLAFPIEGVPLALGYMNAGKVSVKVTLSDAHTYGLDIINVEKMVREWGNKNRDILRAYYYKGWTYPRLRWPSEDNWWLIYFPKKYAYLRVISRIYAIGKINVTLRNEDKAASSVAIGKIITDIYTSDPNKSDPNMLFALRNNIDQALSLNTYNNKNSKSIGGKVHFVSATTQSITFNETFDEPLVIGYIGFDLPIMEHGRLGKPLSTLEQLTFADAITSENIQPIFGNVFGYEALRETYFTLDKRGTEKAKKVCSKLNKLADDILPSSYKFNIRDTSGNLVSGKKKGLKIRDRNFDDVVAYIEDVENTKNTLTNEEIKTDSDVLKAQKEYDRLCNTISRNPAYVETIDYIFFGY